MQQKTNVRLDYKTALQKAEAFCAYQERSQYEVRGKLISLKIYYEELENIILNLIETGFLNEERFSNAYARGKLRIKSWGKNKIKQGLKLKQVSAPLIKKALQNLDGDEYLEKLIGVLEKKAPLIKEKQRFKRNYKLCQYAMSRGFEQDLIFLVLNDREL
ncbi:MAG: RecX family transcriptional regulator [Oligoflexus sp.]|jgi:regulatory protein|nr:RecX family transcriptional regulator [Pseudopedobacter sp.]